MNATGQLNRSQHRHSREPEQPAPEQGRLKSLFGGGIAGNEQLTAMTGVVLILLLAVIGLTILRLGQLISVHLFVGLLLLGPVALKLCSTGYRFIRYYSGNAIYREKGPPDLVLRVIAPVLVLSTVGVFATGIVLLIDGPLHRGPFVMLHKVSFIIWLVFAGLHVLGHLPGFGGALRSAPRATTGRRSGGAGRAISIAGALIAGAVLAIVLIPQFAPWTAHAALAHHDH